MKRLLPLLVLGALVWCVGCDELDDLEEISIDLGGWAAPFGYGGGYSPYSDCNCRDEYYQEDYYYEEEVWVEDSWDAGFSWW